MSQITGNELIGYYKDDDAEQGHVTISANQQEW